MKKTITLAVAMALALAACGDSDSDDGEAPTTTAAPTTEAAETTDAPAATDAPADAAGGQGAAGEFTLYDLRYCEILLTLTNEDGEEITEVWGTPGVDPCTDEAWDALDPAAIQAENDASFIQMNGPRHFIVDGTVDVGGGSGQGTAAGGEAVGRQFGDITMTLLATTEASEESAAYVPDLVERTTTWAFDAGTEIYELTDPEGNVHVMQSYSLIEDRSITAADLPTLGDRLELPEGWSYSSRVLDEPFVVDLAPEGAFVVQDELRNSYQRIGAGSAGDEAAAGSASDDAMAGEQTPEGGMIVVNDFGPSTPEQIAEFQEPGPDGPIFMVNLLEFKDQAEYEDGRETDLTGAEAYAIYEEGVSELIQQFGGEVVFEADVTFLTIGQVGELWDAVGIARYPSRATLAEMSSSPEFAELSVHRTAGLAGQLNIETVEPVG
ncbi:MAG: DUF1330 domain-containing protein [Actinomycetota bacterium]